MRPINRIRAARDSENYELMETPQGRKIHFVGTGLPTSLLVRGGQAEGVYSEDADKALCGTVTEFEEASDVPEDPGDDLSRFCTPCRRQAIAKEFDLQGQFQDLPL